MSTAFLPPLGALVHVQPPGWRIALKLWLPPYWRRFAALASR